MRRSRSIGDFSEAEEGGDSHGSLAPAALEHASQLDGFWESCFDQPSAGDEKGWGSRSGQFFNQDQSEPRTGFGPGHFRSSSRNTEKSEKEFEFNVDTLFQFRPGGVSFLERALVREAVEKANSRLAAVRSSASARPRQIAEVIRKRREKLERLTTAPKFLRTSDKLVFTLGVVVMLVTEGVMLIAPQNIPALYVALMIPLLVIRWVQYAAVNFHFFFLDFCYFVQFLILMTVMAPSPAVFGVSFLLSTGPLAFAVPLWRNSLVFHDLDKMTSVGLHMLPPIVVYVLRWHSPADSLAQICGSECVLDGTTFVLSLVVYLIWQALYLFATEVVFREKIRCFNMMTSVKWLSDKRPHPIYNFLRSKGVKMNPVALLVTCQFIYTVITVLPCLWLYESYFAHSAYLMLIFLAAIWNGANFYFEVFSESYSKRLASHMKAKNTGEA